MEKNLEKIKNLTLIKLSPYSRQNNRLPKMFTF